MRNLFVALCVVATSPAIAQQQDKLFTNDINVRTVLAYKVPDAAVQKMLPAGWELNSPLAGPTKGFNLGITLIDSLMVQDPEGKALSPINIIVLNAPAKKTGTNAVGTMVFGGFTGHASVPGAYGVYDAAKITIDRRSHADAEGKTVIDETWEAKADDGNAIEIQVQYTRGTPARSKVEARVYSAAKPEFYRIYRFEQAADVARSIPAEIDRVTKFSLKATGPKLAPLFGGSEQLISITSVPFYSRSIYLPAL
jgi:hypothetical protein